MHIVEIWRRDADLGAVMEQMRTWLDHHRVEPSLFNVVFIASDEIRFRLEFKNSSDASGFARAFNAEMLVDGDVTDNLAA
jgi:hypothetical protein